MAFQGWIRLSGSCAVVLAVVAGCRGTRAPVLDRTAAGIVYDTAHEADLRNGNAPALVSEAWGRYVDTLAEPAAIVGWQEGVSTWEVFFATNRERSFGSSDDRVQFANGVRKDSLYGRAEVTLPRRGRGVDPARAPSLNRAMPISFTKPRSPDEVVRFESVQLRERETFLGGVHAQLERSRQRDLLVFVHGFNVDFESAVIRAAQVALDLPFNGAIIAYAWPSQGGVQNYSSDEPINRASVEPFTTFLQSLLDAVPPETRVSILVHSMGNRIVMQGINRLRPDSQLAHVILCAPDVGLTDFEAWAPGVASRAEKVTLYASENDAALIASRSLHAEQRAGDADPPVVAGGIETIDCSTVDYTSFLGHSYYGANRQVLGDLFLLLKENRAADERPHLKREASRQGDFWIFQGNAPNVLVTWHFGERASK